MFLKNRQQKNKEKGFVILIAVLVSSLLISIGTFISIIALKEIKLSSSSKDSQAAFYAADSAIECALYRDFRGDPFPGNQTDVNDISSGSLSGVVNCNNQDWTLWHANNIASAPSDIADIQANDDRAISYFEVSFARSQQGELEVDQPYARVRIEKNNIGTSNDKTIIQAWGHNKKSGIGIVERALKVTY